MLDMVTGQQNWSDVLKEAIHKLVDLGIAYVEVCKGEVPVQLCEPYFKRHDVVMKFDYDGLGNVFWVHYNTSKFTTTTQMAEANKAEGTEEEVEDAEDETPVVVVTGGPVLVHSLPSMQQICPSRSEHERYKDSWITFLNHAKATRGFTRPQTVIVQPSVLALQECETSMCYSFDQQEKLLPLAEMQLRPSGAVIPFPVSKDGVEVTHCRLIKKMRKVWKEKLVDKPNFKQDAGSMITNPPRGIYKQPFLPFRVSCYTDKLFGGNKEFCVVNSLGIFPMVDIELVGGGDVVATLVMDRCCDWATSSLEGYPVA